MLAPQTTRTTRHAARLVSLFLVGCVASSCATHLREVGRAPEGEVRDRETAQSRAESARREDARHDRQDAEEAATRGATGAAAPPSAAMPGRVETPSAEKSRTGTASTRRFHAAGCPDLDAAPTADRVLFVSYWDAVDGDYAPCPRCKPGP
ncbi:MAG: hypothetical protein K8T90_12980 [Planctomycetes bacterium]|nr:hypothetical protein [Planctomycetota bacterium]